MRGSTDKFIAYYRVSTERQGRSGLGLDAQRQAVLDYLNGNGWELIGEFTEIETGRTPAKITLAKRPELQKALVDCKRQHATLIIAKLDRLARNVAFISTLMEAGVEFRAADMPNADNFMLHVYAAMAQEEGRRISERTKAALAAAKQRGVKLGSPNPRKGSAIGVKAIRAKADLDAANVLPVIEEIRANGSTSLRAIAYALNVRGVATARGGRWGPSAVRNVLARGNR